MKLLVASILLALPAFAENDDVPSTLTNIPPPTATSTESNISVDSGVFAGYLSFSPKMYVKEETGDYVFHLRVDQPLSPEIQESIEHIRVAKYDENDVLLGGEMSSVSTSLQDAIYATNAEQPIKVGDLFVVYLNDHDSFNPDGNVSRSRFIWP